MLAVMNIVASISRKSGDVNVAANISPVDTPDCHVLRGREPLAQHEEDVHDGRDQDEAEAELPRRRSPIA